MASIPLAVNAPDPNQPLRTAEGLQGIQGQQQAMQLRALLAPGELQQQQQALQQGQQGIQTGAIDLQMKQIGLKNAQTVQTALSDPKFSDYLTQAGSSAGNAGGSSVSLHPIAQVLASKYGLPMMGPNGALEISQQFTKAAQEQATLAKTQGDTAQANLKNSADQLTNFDNLVEPVLLEKDPAKQQEGIANIQAEIKQNPQLYPQDAIQHIDQLGTIQGLQGAANTSKMRQMLIKDITDQAKGSQEVAAAAKPTSEQLGNALNTLQTYAAIPGNMRLGLANEMKAAPDWETLQGIQKRADAAQESFQRSADARQEATAMRNIGVQTQLATKLAGEDQKLGTALDQTQGIRQLLDMSKGGNQVATNAALTRFAEHEIVEGGVKRMNQTEYNNLATSLGDYGRKFQAWADGGFKGQMPPATNAEMQKILDAEDANANLTHERNVGYYSNRFGDISGMGGNAKKQARQPPKQSGPPAGATHQVLNRADGKMHWTNAQGTQDLGVAQ